MICLLVYASNKSCDLQGFVFGFSSDSSAVLFAHFVIMHHDNNEMMKAIIRTATVATHDKELVLGLLT